MKRIHPTRTLLLATVGTMLLWISSSTAQAPHPKDEKPGWVDRFFGLHRDRSGGWLFVASKEDGEDGVYFAISKDGYHWQLVNNGQPLLKPSHRGELIRDPFVQRAPDGTFRMVWTWSTGTPAVIGYSTSDNLLFWNEQRQLPVTEAIPLAINTWAPAIYYEPDKKNWLVLWSSNVLADGNTGGAQYNRIYATDTREFKRFTPARLFFDPGYTVTGATLVPASGRATRYYLLFTGERGAPPTRRIAAAVGPTIDGPWREIGEPFGEAGTEAPVAIPAVGGYLVYYDHDGTPRHYEAALSGDLQHWSDTTSNISLPAGLSHGSLIHLETSEYNLLLDYHGVFESAVRK
jgi:hypothetical protein